MVEARRSRSDGQNSDHCWSCWSCVRRGGVELSPDIYRQMFQITYNICKEESHLVERSHDKDKTDSGQRFAHLVILLHIDRVDEFDCKFAQLTTIVPGSAGPICFIGLICLE